MAAGESFREISLWKVVKCSQRRNLVAFGQGRIVENVIDKIIQLAAMGHDRLANMNQLRCSFPDDMDTEKLSCLAMKQQL